MGNRKIASCGACRLPRRKCSEECILAPHFPRDDPDKFIVVQKVFGANNVVKLLQGLDSTERVNAINCLVCEANARVNNPIHGSAGVIHKLQKRISELESQLTAKQEELTNMCSKFDMLSFPMYTRSPHVQDDLHHTGTLEGIVYDELGPLWCKPI